MSQIRIKDHGRLLVLDYEHFLAYHGNGALAGAAIGFRAMEYAGVVLSRAKLWDRKDLSVTTWHSGPGVRDAIEYVTRCVTRGRFSVDEAQAKEHPCASQVAFHFAVSDGWQQVVITMRTGVVARKFLDAVRRFQDGGGTGQEREEFEALKAAVAVKVMAKPLEGLFTLELKAKALPEHA